MKNLFIGIVIGVSLVMFGIFIADQKSGVKPPLAISGAKEKLIDTKTNDSSIAGTTNRATIAPQAKVEIAESNAPPVITKPASLQNRLADYETGRDLFSKEVQNQKLNALKHEIAQNADSLNISEIVRDAEVSDVRLANKHLGRLYKFAGMILDTNNSDITLVIKNTEVVCTFVPSEWRPETLKKESVVYLCGTFESFRDAHGYKQITMANCYIIENFNQLRHSELSEAEKKEAINEQAQNIFYMIEYNMNPRKPNN